MLTSHDMLYLAVFVSVAEQLVRTVH